MLKKLADQGITRLMVEGGPKVAASFVAADLIDEAVLVRADKTIGSGIDALEGMPLDALTGKMQAWHRKAWYRCDRSLRATYNVHRYRHRYR